RIERRLGVARGSELAGEVARLALPAVALRAEKRCDEAQQRPPALHVLAVFVNGGGIRPGAIVEGVARLVQNAARGAAKRLADPEIRTDAGFAAQGKVDPP